MLEEGRAFVQAQILPGPVQLLSVTTERVFVLISTGVGMFLLGPSGRLWPQGSLCPGTGWSSSWLFLEAAVSDAMSLRSKEIPSLPGLVVL